MADQDGCCCSCGSDCCAPAKEKKKIIIDFLFLDLSICTRCQGTENALDEAISDVEVVLNAAGYEVVVNKIHVDTKELAIQHKFESSPTIRVNGKDIDVEVKESLCDCCGDLCGDNVDCRVWTYQGQEYTIPPKALIVNAILAEVYGGGAPVQEKEYILPKNLEAFYEAMDKKK
ncbi:MAG: hypothetical protein BWY11_02260 [Firmicutes bacterium ADurb.Bin182]|nr:MAG: hypothetical protein BWY11_02260 [Firmicutes bacterium ADurb.Bin182]